MITRISASVINCLAAAFLLRAVQMAGDMMAGFDLHDFRFLPGADVHDIRAAWVKPAALRQVYGGWDFTLERCLLNAAIGIRRRAKGQKRFCVRMAWVFE